MRSDSIFGTILLSAMPVYYHFWNLQTFVLFQNFKWTFSHASYFPDFVCFFDQFFHLCSVCAGWAAQLFIKLGIAALVFIFLFVFIFF